MSHAQRIHRHVGGLGTVVCLMLPLLLLKRVHCRLPPHSPRRRRHSHRNSPLVLQRQVAIEFGGVGVGGAGSVGAGSGGADVGGAGGGGAGVGGAGPGVLQPEVLKLEELTLEVLSLGVLELETLVT
ncbi:unnamed protein product [Closterium sp. Naga37s-1]|nr:unnamed protein product [Closterium sp. Naga37s-1]